MGAWSAGTSSVISPVVPGTASVWPAALIPLQRSGSGTQFPWVAVGVGAVSTVAVAALVVGTRVAEGRHEAEQDKAEQAALIADIVSQKPECPPPSDEGQEP